MSDDKTLRRAFGDIVKGYSPCTLLGQQAYILHLGHFSQLEIDSIFESYYTKAINRGVPTEADAIKFAIENKLWNQAFEDDVKQIDSKIKFATENKKVQNLPSQIKNLNKEIDKLQHERIEIISQRNAVIGITAEMFAEQKTNHYYIYSSFYKEPTLTTKLFSQEEFDYLSEVELYAIIQVYNTELSRCSQDNIKKISVKPFFQNYFYISSSVTDFYGKPAIQLTYNQVSLANYGRYFKNIFENNDKIPDNIKENPDELIDYVMVKSRNGAGAHPQGERSSSRQDHDDLAEFASLPFGATKEDLKTLGYDQEKSVNLDELAKAKGGRLTMADMLAIAGQK